MLIRLDSPEALDPRRVGAKASLLAAAGQAGLCVLDGLVMEIGYSLPCLAAAARVAIETGPAAGQLAIMEWELPAELIRAVSETRDWPRIVVRSSSPLEDAGEWSGAFASYVDVSPDEVEAAVRGCWSSMLGRDALARFERAGRDPATTGMAVLIQPAITPSPGGVAEVDDSGVHITVADDGQLAGLLQGWATGSRAELPLSGPASGPAVEQYGLPLLERVADLSRTCRQRLGANHLEWAYADQRCYLLQARRAEVRPPQLRRIRATTLVGPAAVRIAQAVARFGGVSGDELVLPWYFAPGADGASPSAAASVAMSGAVSVRCAAGALMAQAWRASEEEAGDLARSALARLRDQLDPVAAAELESLAPVDPVVAGTVIAAVERAAASAVMASKLFDAADAWRLPPSHFDQLLEAIGAPGVQSCSSGQQELRPSAGVWEPFLGAVVVANGRLISGDPASAGLGAGRLLALVAPQRLPGVRERWILQVNEPLPVFAPLLWGAAGLVSATGSASAHLFDVARTLGVPAVAGVDVSTGRGQAPVVAVDGSAGEVYVL